MNGGIMMKHSIKILLFVASILVISCIKPVKIIVPESLQNCPTMPVVGTENSWRLDFGGFHAYKIKDRDSRILLTDARNTSYDIKAFEYFLTTTGGAQYDCYCEFPIKSLDDETLRCIFQNANNQFDIGELTDRIIGTATGDITIEGYYEREGKKSGSNKTLVGYLFKDSEQDIGLVDVSNTNNETVWIQPDIDLHKQIMVAAAATSFVLKHRKWYDEFQNKLEQKPESKPF